MASWADTLESAQKTALLQDGRRKVHYTMKNGSELVEEYDAKTNELLVRKWRGKGTLGNTKPWDIEVGDSIPHSGLSTDIGLRENMSTPNVVRLDKVDCFQWRIRNLSYPIDTYQLSIEERNIVVRTTNKKYFKKLGIPDMDRLGLELDSHSLSYAHANNTLIISYKKPISVTEFEKRLLAKLQKLKSDGDVDQCKQQ